MTIISLPKAPSFILPSKPVAAITITNPTLLKILGGVALPSLTAPSPAPLHYHTVGTIGTSELILAGSGNDTLVAGAGSAEDVSAVGKGSTTFLFTECTAASGSIVSLGFEHGRDHIDVVGASNAMINNFVSSQHVTATGTVLHLTDGSALTLVGSGPVTATDFVRLPS